MTPKVSFVRFMIGLTETLCAMSLMAYGVIGTLDQFLGNGREHLMLCLVSFWLSVLMFRSIKESK